MIYLLTMLGILVLDRIVKIVTVGTMQVGDTIPVLGDFFHITYVQNTGAAFSMLEGHPLLLAVLTSIVIGIGIIYVLINYKRYKWHFNVALSLMCAGGLGNLTDRLSNGYVIDMFDFGWFPVFNVADIAVTVGCGILAIYLLLNWKSDEKDTQPGPSKSHAEREKADKIAKSESKKKARSEKAIEPEKPAKKKPKRLK